MKKLNYKMTTDKFIYSTDKNNYLYCNDIKIHLLDIFDVNNYVITYTAKWNGKDCYCEIPTNDSSWLCSLSF